MALHAPRRAADQLLHEVKSERARVTRVEHFDRVPVREEVAHPQRQPENLANRIARGVACSIARSLACHVARLALAQVGRRHARAITRLW